jgi:CCR4-NOT complex subunit CAF16
VARRSCVRRPAAGRTPSAHARTDATHIFDGLDDCAFATHVAHMHLGAFVTEPISWPEAGADAPTLPGNTLYRVALQWLREDRDRRRALEQDGRKKRGARRDQVRQTFYNDTRGR